MKEGDPRSLLRSATGRKKEHGVKPLLDDEDMVDERAMRQAHNWKKRRGDYENLGTHTVKSLNSLNLFI